MWTGYDRQVVKDICYNCNSNISKKSVSYIDYMKHCLPDEKILCEIYDNKGFYFATLGKKHARLIEIAVREEFKGKGYGKMILYRLLKRMKVNGIYKLTFRTPIDEEAQNFWIRQGAVIVGLKENDFLMELNFK